MFLTSIKKIRVMWGVCVGVCACVHACMHACVRARARLKFGKKCWFRVKV